MSEHNNGVLKKIFNVMNDLGWIEKNATVDIGRRGYNYTSETQMLAELIPLFKKHKLLFMPVRVKQFNTVEKRIAATANKPENVSYLVDLVMNYRFIDPDDGSFLDVEMAGQGADSLDKAVYKAATGCFKYALRESLMIGTGDDPEASDETGKIVAVNNNTFHTMTAVKAAFIRNNLKLEDFNDLWNKHNIDTSTSQPDSQELKSVGKKMAQLAADITKTNNKVDAIKTFEKSL